MSLKFFEDPERRVTIWRKNLNGKDRGTFTSGWENPFTGDTINEVWINGASMVEVDEGFVETTLHKVTGELTILIRKSRSWKRILFEPGISVV